MSEGQIRVVVVDDHAVVREGIRGVLASSSDIDVVGEASDGAEALELVAATQPDVVVLDLTMPGMSGLEATAKLRDAFDKVRVLILSMHDHPEYVLQAVRAGAHGYVLKDATPEELRAAVKAVYSGEEYIAPAAARQLNVAVRGEQKADARRALVAQLTRREREVLVRIARGLTNKDIAAELGISPRTVETHRDGIARKLGIRSVAELTRLVLEADITSDS
jgi:DNA-binding NarL/FixJ family response regulator